MKVLDAEEIAPQAGALFEQVGDEPVLIRRGEQELAVMLTAEEYRRLRASELEGFHDLCVRMSAYAQASGLTEEKLAEILADDRD